MRSRLYSYLMALHCLPRQRPTPFAIGKALAFYDLMLMTDNYYYSQRREAKEKALKMEKTADKDHEQLARLFNLSTSVTNKMIRKFMEVLRRMDITFYVAPYEADAQLAFMSRNRMVDVVIMEDADSIPYGCKKVVKLSA